MKKAKKAGLGLSLVGVLAGGGCGVYVPANSHHSRDWYVVGAAAREAGITNGDSGLTLYGDWAINEAHVAAPFDAVNEAEERVRNRRNIGAHPVGNNVRYPRSVKTIVNLNEDTFYEFTREGNSIVLFYADWDPHSAQMSRDLENISRNLIDIDIGKIDFDSNRRFASSLDIETLPFTLFFDDGMQVGSYRGAMDKRDIADKIFKHYLDD